jgi:hypothetical protein
LHLFLLAATLLPQWEEFFFPPGVGGPLSHGSFMSLLTGRKGTSEHLYLVGFKYL